MRSIESEGDSIDEAIDSALRALQIGRDRVEIEILENATRGLLGFGGRKARVRATVRAPLSAALAAGAGGGPASAIVSGETPEAARSQRPRASTPSRSSPNGERDGDRSSSVPSDLQARARALLADLLVHVGVSCTVEARRAEDPGVIALEVVGDSSGLLIGRRGQTLDALEYVVNRMAAREDEAGAARIVVDVEGYRARRRTSLEALAHRLAEKAKQTGRVVTVNPLSPRDRRIVHLTLQGETAITTRSQGEGYYRKVLIVPADRARGASRPSRSPE